MPHADSSRRNWRFAVWEALGVLAWNLGTSICHEGGLIHRFGLWLCGCAGSFDGRADGYR